MKSKPIADYQPHPYYGACNTAADGRCSECMFIILDLREKVERYTFALAKIAALAEDR